MSVRPNPRRDPESGYVMLFVLLMAAVIAIALYKAMPRFVFEQQRAKEQTLIDRGEQYKRAIQLFVRKVGRYPATIEELESTNNIRFLRKRYVDPMTGKDKWRLLHVNGGVITDSIVKKDTPGQPGGQPGASQGQPGASQGQQQQQPDQSTYNNTFIAEGPVLGATPNDPDSQQNNLAFRRRPSDKQRMSGGGGAQSGQPVSGGDGGDSANSGDSDQATDPNAAAGTDPNANPNANAATPQPNPPGVPAGVPGGVLGQPGAAQPGNNSGTQSSSGGVYVAPSLGQQPAATPTPAPGGQQPYGSQQPYGGVPGQPMGLPGQAGNFPGQSGMYPGQSGAIPGQQGGFGQPSGFGQQASFPGQQAGGFGSQPQAGPGGPGGGLINMNTLLGPTRGLTGVPGVGGTQIGGGIAGVASESKGRAIMIYNKQKKYNEWEFVYDQSKDHGLAGLQPGGGLPGTPAQQMGNMPPGIMPGQAGAPGYGQSSSSGLGLSSGFGSPSGQGSGFGQSGFGQSGAGQSGFGQSGFGQSGFGQSSTGFGSSQQPQQPQQPPTQQGPPN